MSDDDLIYSPDMIRERAEVLIKVRKSWKGRADYALTIDMEIWCLRSAAALLEAALVILDDRALALGVEFTPTERLQAAKRIASGVGDNELLQAILTAGETAN